MADPYQLASTLLREIPARDMIMFGYGQGSAFTQFGSPADIDLVMVWPEVPDRGRRLGATVVGWFEGPDYALDKITGPDIDVMHLSIESFTQWSAVVEQGRGWREEVWPLPLHVIAGFAQGRLLWDPLGEGSSWQDRVGVPTDQFVSGVLTSLARDLDGYLFELRAGSVRGDHWLAGRLVDRLMRHCYIAWFAAEGYYCPFPKHLCEWVARLGLDRGLADLERAVWSAPDPGSRVDALEALARGILAIGVVGP